MFTSFSAVLAMVIAVMCQTGSSKLLRNVLKRDYLNYMGLDNYQFKYQTPDGVSRKEKGYFSSTGVWTVVGEVSWITSDGNVYSYNYLANDNGYKQMKSPSTDAAAGIPTTTTTMTTVTTSSSTVTTVEAEVTTVSPFDEYYYYRPSGHGAAHRPPIYSAISCGTKAALLGCGKR